MSEVKSEIKDGQLIITLPINGGVPSRSGKMMVCASTYGFKPAGVNHNGRPLLVSVNAGVKN